MKINKVLIIRFSSFGDIVQCSSVVELITQKHEKAQVDWITRSEFANLVKLNNKVSNVWGFNRKEGLIGLIKLGFKLRAENYDHIYDAHNNLRSKVLKFILKTRLTNRPDWVTRSKDRLKRILLFSFRINLLPNPFRGIKSFVKPLEKWELFPTGEIKLVTWNFPKETTEKVKHFVEKTNTVVLVPSAAWEMKRWPLEYFKELVTMMPECHFVVLGGKEDTFCEEIKAMAPERVENLAGALSLVESCALVSLSKTVISADTGLLHVADVMGVSALSLMGPTAFGFTTGKQIKTMEVDLSCRPCTKDGRGKCSQAVYKRCMMEITPLKIAQELRENYLRA